MEQLLALASEVQKYREAQVRFKSVLGEHQQAFNADHAELIQTIQGTAAALQGAESDLRKATVAAYNADPEHNKAVLPGVVAIRDNTIVGFNPDEALEWAKRSGLALMLDERVYEKLVKIGQAPGTVQVEPQATIAREIRLPTPQENVK